MKTINKIIYPMAFTLLLMSCGSDSNESNDSDNTTESEMLSLSDEEMELMAEGGDVTYAEGEMGENGDLEPLSSSGEGFNNLTIEDYAAIDSKTELYRRYSDEYLMEDEAWFKKEDKTMEATTLIDPKSGERIKFIWGDDNKTTYMVESQFNFYDDDQEKVITQNVNSDCGVRTGMPLSELVEWNGEAVDFNGFGMSDEGGIFTKRGSKIDGCQLKIRLSYDENIEFEGRDELMKNKSFSSDDAIVEDAPIFVGSIAVIVNEDATK